MRWKLRGAKGGRKKDATSKQMMEEQPDQVLAPDRGLKQAGDKRVLRTWAEPSVWTRRMLAAVENETVKGGKWFSLIDKIHKPANLAAAFKRVAANKGSAGIDHVSIRHFGQHAEEELDKLRHALRTRSYRPQAIRRVHIPKPGKREKRPLGVPTVRDRVVQTAVRQAIEPIFDHSFADCSYGFRPGLGCKDALREVDRLLHDGNLHVVEVDFRKFFDTLDHGILMDRVMEKIADGEVLSLIGDMLSQGVMEQGKQWTPEKGTPQGGPISPLLANIYLNPLDHLLTEAGFQMVRYADDMVILCRSEEEAASALSMLSEWSLANGLSLHPDKTRVTDLHQIDAHVDFLGYQFKRTKRGALKRYPSKSNIVRLHRNLSPILRRSNGKSLEELIYIINRKLRGWFEYFKSCSWGGLDGVDKWVRMRLRSILRKRLKMKGRGRGSDHQRWPNKFFADHGLFSLTAAHEELRQSARR